MEEDVDGSSPNTSSDVDGNASLLLLTDPLLDGYRALNPLVVIALQRVYKKALNSKERNVSPQH
eukprot:scaffold1675_cov146-Skeletonema_menzelii.AAC.20